MRGCIVIVSVSAVVLAACTSDGPHPGASDRRLPMPTVGAVPAPLIRGCESAVFGEPNLENAFTIGPLVLVGIPQAESSRVFKPHEGRYAGVKLLAVVNGSDDVTVSVSESQRESVALLYDPEARANKNGYSFSAGDHRVTFRACPGTEAQYNGGLIAKRPICVSLFVQSEESSLTGSIPLGAAASCPD
jgi:hypothetical protein